MRKRSACLTTLLVALTLCLALAPAAGAETVPELTHPTLPRDISLTPEVVCLGEEDRDAAQLLGGSPEDVAGAIQAVREGIVAGKERVDISRYAIPISDFQSITNYMYSRYPELFAVGMFSYSYTYGGQTVTAVNITYTMTAEEYDQAKAFYNEELDRISGLVDPDWSREAKLLFLHDYLATHYEYDLTHQIHDAYNMLKEGVGVCQGYTLLMSGLLDRLDIPVSYVISDDLNHIWNMVQMENGQWYHMDVTWDDPTGAPYSINHSYLLVSDGVMEEDHVVGDKDWVYGTQALPGTQSGDSPCTDAAYDGHFWREATTPFVAVNGSFYFLDKTALNRWTGEEAATAVADVAEGMACTYSGLGYYGGKLYYNTPTALASYSLYTGEITHLLEVKGWEEQFTGCELHQQPDGTLRMNYETYVFDLASRETGALEGLDPCHRTAEDGYGYYLDGEALTLVAPEEGAVAAAWYDAQGKLTSVAFYENGERAVLDPGQKEARLKLMGTDGSWTPYGAAAELAGDYSFQEPGD